MLSTSLYFVVFGAAIGSRITQIEGVSYGAFIVPGLIMLMLLTQSMMNASFGIYFPRFTGTIYELLSAPVSYFEIVLGYVGAAATQVDHPRPDHPGDGVPVRAAAHRASVLDAGLPGADRGDLQPVRLHHRHLGRQASRSCRSCRCLIITPLTFLGGTFYSISMLPPLWQKVTLFNPVVYLISGFRWSFFEIADVSVAVSLGMTLVFLVVCLAIIWWIFKTGYRLKN